MDSPPPIEQPEEIEYSTTQRRAILARKKYAGDKLSNNEISGGLVSQSQQAIG